MTVQLRHTAQDIGDFCRWARVAIRGDWCVYHSGRLAHDRRHSAGLHRLAATVLVLQSTGFLNPAQYQNQARGRAHPTYTYYAVRTGDGYAPRHLLDGSLRADQWRALEAILKRCDPHPQRPSALRVVRDAGMPVESQAKALIAEMLAAGWIEDHPSRGIHVTDFGIAMMT